jgi:hypothetical protein
MASTVATVKKSPQCVFWSNKNTNIFSFSDNKKISVPGAVGNLFCYYMFGYLVSNISISVPYCKENSLHILANFVER